MIPKLCKQQTEEKRVKSTRGHVLDLRTCCAGSYRAIGRIGIPVAGRGGKHSRCCEHTLQRHRLCGNRALFLHCAGKKWYKTRQLVSLRRWQHRENKRGPDCTHAHRLPPQQRAPVLPARTQPLTPANARGGMYVPKYMTWWFGGFVACARSEGTTPACLINTNEARCKPCECKQKPATRRVGHRYTLEGQWRDTPGAQRHRRTRRQR